MSPFRALSLLFAALLALSASGTSIARAADFCERYLVDAGAVAKAPGAYGLARGDRVKLRAGAAQPVNAVFLGRLVGLDNTTVDLAFYDPTAALIHVIPKDRISITRGTPTETIAIEDTSPAVRSVNQEGATCAAYSMFNCLRQMQYDGHEGNKKLKDAISNEPGRLSFVVRAVTRLYSDHVADLMTLDELATTYGFKIYKIPYSSAKELKSEVLKYLGQGWPITLAFDVPNDMTTTPYTIIDHSNDKPLDRRLWKPKGMLQGRNSRHMIVALGAFEVDGKTMILVSDPNWQAPRLWDLDDLDRANPSSMDAIVLWQENAAPPAP